MWIRTLNDSAPSDMTVFRKGLNLLRSSHIRVQNIQFESVFMNRAESCSSVTVSNVMSKYSTHSGFYFYSTTNCVIDDVSVEQSGETGIYLLLGLSNIVRNSTVTGISTTINGFPSGGGDRGGVGLFIGNCNTVEHCKFYNAGYQMSGTLDVWYENDAVVRWNYSDSANGFYPHGNNNVIYGNTVIGNGVGNAGSVGICPDDHLDYNTYGKTGVRTNNYVFNNTFYSCGALIVYPGGVVKNNIIYGNSGLLIHRQYDVDGDTDIDVGETDYNVFYLLPPYESDARFIIWEPSWPGGSEVLYQTLASYRAALGQDAHSIHDNPDFISGTPIGPSGLKLTEVSPAIGVGVNVNVDTDYAGNAFRDSPSMGAFEWYKISRAANLRVQSLKGR